MTPAAATSSPSKRSQSMRVRLQPQIRERLDALSDLYGLPPATIIAFVTGQWIAQQEKTAAMVGNITETLSAELKNQAATFIQAMAESPKE